MVDVNAKFISSFNKNLLGLTTDQILNWALGYKAKNRKECMVRKQRMGIVLLL